MSAPAHPDPHLRLRFVALVFLGGCLGTAARYGVVVLLPHRAGTWPWATFGVNLTGAFLLGVLLETLARRGPDDGARRILRLGLGTGFLGAYTTYSALAVDGVLLSDHGATALAPAYAAASVALGLLAAGLGLALGRLVPPGRRPVAPAQEPVDPDLPTEDDVP